MMKYYTPNIEEFHVGFEYESYEMYYTHEYDEGTPTWIKRTVTDINQKQFIGEERYRAIYHVSINNSYEENVEWNKNIRVKTLDEDDLVDLGWKTAYSTSYVMDGQFTLLHSIGEEPKWFNLEKDGKLIVITECTIYNEVSGNWEQESIFRGRVKNKSELRKLMQQLEIQ